MMSGGSLRLRLLWGGGISIILALAFSAAGLTLLFSRHVERRVDSELGVYLDQLVAGLSRDTSTGKLVIARPPGDPRFDVPLSGLYWQVRAGGTLLRSRSLWDGVLALPEDDLADGALHRHIVTAPDGAEVLALERSVRLPSRLGVDSARVATAVSLTDVREATRDFALGMLPYLFLLALFLITAAYVQVTVGLRPLRRVRERLKTIRQDPTADFGGGFPHEIMPIAEELDNLLSARRSQIEKARTRAADLAHGLKTPLQVLLGDVQRLRDLGHEDVARDVEQVAAAMQRHVERELAKARISAGSATNRAGIEEVAKRVVSVVARTPAGSALTWDQDIAADIHAVIDPDDLAEALGNLLENAARHARSKIRITGRRTDGMIKVSVEDDGPGIPEDNLKSIMGRGIRLDQSPTGTGLGLAIVQDIAEAWSGRLELASGPDGLKAQLWLKTAS